MAWAALALAVADGGDEAGGCGLVGSADLAVGGLVGWAAAAGTGWCVAVEAEPVGHQMRTAVIEAEILIS
ncbi:hypothetical protein ACSTLH_00545, partial [Vibrio parahaemolyticus]